MFWLFLDDERIPEVGQKISVFNGFKNFEYSMECPMVIARSYDEALNILTERGCPSFVSFDHDLGLGKSGYDFAKWLVECDIEHEGKYIPDDFNFIVHSANPVGARNIENYLRGWLNFR